MAITEAPPPTPDAPPAVRGPWARLAAAILEQGDAELVFVVGVIGFSQGNYAV